MSALQPAHPEPSGPGPDDATGAPGHAAAPVAPRRAPRRRTSVAWPAPAPQAVPPGQRRPAPPAVVPEPASAPAPTPVAATVTLPRFVAPRPAPAAPPVAPTPPTPFPRFQAPVPPAAPTPPPAPAPQPVSLAGADVPALLAPEPPAPTLPPLPEEPLAGRLDRPAAAPRTVAPARPTPPSAPPRPADGASAAPPGFAAERLVVAASAELLALDPSLDDEQPTDEIPAAAAPAAAAAAAAAPAVSGFDPLTLTPEEAASLGAPLRMSLPTEHASVPSAAAPPAEIGGSRLAGRALAALPRRGDLRAFGRDRGASARVALAIIVVSVLIVIAGAKIADLLRPVPLIGSAVDTLQAIALYPKVYGVEWVTATLAIFCLGGVIFAHMEQQAERQDMRRDPVRRLNIALTSMLALTLGSGVMSLMHDRGWAAAASATGFFAALFLAIPIARFPGARAMQMQPDRAWGLLLLVSLPAVFIASIVPTLAIAILALTHVRTRWAQVQADADDYADGPVDRGNRRGALIITLAIVIVSAIGFNAMHQSVEDLRGLQQQERTAFPGAEQGPTIDEATP
ncbi:MAG: hypothetical protein J7513_01115 [Solirubrobacteraceae bacterium]|nr:hypothetical protein [Solirubrobacteraceae bacterium]